MTSKMICVLGAALFSAPAFAQGAPFGGNQTVDTDPIIISLPDDDVDSEPLVWTVAVDILCPTGLGGWRHTQTEMTAEEEACCIDAGGVIREEAAGGACTGSITVCDLGPGIGWDDVDFLSCVL